MFCSVLFCLLCCLWLPVIISALSLLEICKLVLRLDAPECFVILHAFLSSDDFEMLIFFQNQHIQLILSVLPSECQFGSRSGLTLSADDTGREGVNILQWYIILSFDKYLHTV